MTTTKQRRAASAEQHAQKVIHLLCRAHGLSKTLELAIQAAADRHEQMQDSVVFSSFVTSIEQTNDAISEALDTAHDEANRIQSFVYTEARGPEALL